MPVETCQSFTVSSALALANTVPSGPERQIVNRTVMATERTQLFAARRVPQDDLAVVAASGERRSIRTCCRVVHRVAVTGEFADERSVRSVPGRRFAEQSDNT